MAEPDLSQIVMDHSPLYSGKVRGPKPQWTRFNDLGSHQKRTALASSDLVQFVELVLHHAGDTEI
jgi:hypothetical protein